MKFLSLLFIFNIFILTFVKSINVSYVLKRDVTYDEESFKNSLGKECREEYENSEYNECMPTITLSNYKNACSEVISKKCKNFFIDPLSYYPICKNNPVFNEMYQPIMIKTLIQAYDIYCQTDENGDLCPYSLYAITKSGGNEALHDQCKSKKCTESLLKINKDLNIDQYAAFESNDAVNGSYSYEELNAKNDIISVLESDECQSSHVTSDAVTVKLTNKFYYLYYYYHLLFIE